MWRPCWEPRSLFSPWLGCPKPSIYFQHRWLQHHKRQMMARTVFGSSPPPSEKRDRDSHLLPKLTEGFELHFDQRTRYKRSTTIITDKKGSLQTRRQTKETWASIQQRDDQQWPTPPGCSAPEHLQTAHSTKMPQQHPHLPFERGMTSLGHKTFPDPVFTSGKKQAQPVLEATTAFQMCQPLQMWRRAGCTKGRCSGWRAQGHATTTNEVQAPGLSLAEGRTLSWTILWPGLVQSADLHPHQPKKAMEKTS